MRKGYVLITCLALAAVLLAFLLGFSKGLRKGKAMAEPPEPEIQTDTVWLKPDTIRIPKPVPVAKWVHDTTYVLVTDTILLHSRDTAWLPIPRETTYYARNDYEAWVTGFRATLDSVHIFRPVAIVEKKVPVYLTKRWGVGIQAGITWNPQTKTTPYVGAGVSYNLFTF